MTATETSDANKQSESRARTWTEVAIVWLLVSAFGWARTGADVVALRFLNTDDAARLLQLRQLLEGQGWWDLTLQRMGSGGVDMHWSRHMDTLLGAVVVVVRPLTDSSVAELAAIVAVPLLLLLAALALIAGIAKEITDKADAGLFAMIMFGFGAAGLSRFGPGRIDHHGLQIVLVLLMVRLILRWPSRGAVIGAGIAGGVSLTVGLGTLPMIAALLAGVGIRWVAEPGGDRAAYRAFGISTVLSTVVSGLVFAPPGRILSLECDVLSLGLFGLVAIPALGLAAMGGRSWGTARRWMGLGGTLVLAVGWLGSFSPSCATGPYAGIPDVGRRVWLDLITEARGLASFAETFPWEATALALAPMVAVVVLGATVWRRRWIGAIPWLLSLIAAVIVGLWQVRALPIGLALAAPVLGLIVVSVRDRVPSMLGRAVVTLLALFVLSGVLFGFLAQFAGPRSDSATETSGPCITDEVRRELSMLEPALVAAEMNLGPDILVHTDHRVLAPQYHRDYQSVLEMYDLFISEPSDAAAGIADLGVGVVVVCDDSTISRSWAADNPSGLLARLLADDPPDYLQKVIDIGRTRAYLVR